MFRKVHHALYAFELRPAVRMKSIKVPYRLRAGVNLGLETCAFCPGMVLDDGRSRPIP
jgi:hypothetical protein